MLKYISTYGKKLSISELKNIEGKGGIDECSFSNDPSTDWCCHLPGGCP
ncbi:hypothetical protein [Abyssalbus ytuae]|uniref:Uncharacterized protein n=1 Tax=Abyssalbus ytuae TaxID=2926907 RepID=A0A9E6ZNQ1_9FLAO|nr:hypothetical protein [Abyssalbus ytuae]UOB17720.1 hypothetical protein MQE35_00130 [Abyssalbus ytuae]